MEKKREAIILLFWSVLNIIQVELLSSSGVWQLLWAEKLLLLILQQLVAIMNMCAKNLGQKKGTEIFVKDVARALCTCTGKHLQQVKVDSCRAWPAVGIRNDAFPGVQKWTDRAWTLLFFLSPQENKHISLVWCKITAFSVEQIQSINMYEDHPAWNDTDGNQPGPPQKKKGKRKLGFFSLRLKLRTSYRYEILYTV